MNYIFDKVNKNTIDDIMNGASSLLNRIPNAPELKLRPDYVCDLETSLFYCSDVGYYYVLFLGDHAQVCVDFWGKTTSDVIKNLIKNEVELYCLVTSSKLGKSYNDFHEDFWNYCKKLLHFDNFNRSESITNFKELYIPFFIEKSQYLPKELIIKNIVSQRHRLFYNPQVGYYYSKPINDTRKEVSFIGMNESEAISWIYQKIIGG